MSLKKPHKWECFANHVPDWVEQYAFGLVVCMEGSNDDKRIDGIVERYNDIIDIEEDRNTDPSELFGLDREKQSLVEEALNIFAKYKDSAIERQKPFDKMK